MAKTKLYVGDAEPMINRSIKLPRRLWDAFNSLAHHKLIHRTQMIRIALEEWMQLQKSQTK
jgi:metal-responsive CopG/Arc/MetJ family transcriptional regulator